jgi:cyclopropane fatty-acyl-phospholipid synthase-like methyltransferase
MKIHENGFWLENTLNGHYHDKNLSLEFRNLFKGCSVLDLGCGHGQYTIDMLDNGIYCEGYDGNPYTPEITNNVCKILDLTTNFNLNKKFDWVLSLEVGEHIPPEYENVYLNNLDKHCKKGIVLSWAIEGQGGDGHVNCKNNDYVKNIFNNMGYINEVELENKLRDICYLRWLKKTIMVFKKQ